MSQLIVIPNEGDTPELVPLTFRRLIGLISYEKNPKTVFADEQKAEVSPRSISDLHEFQRVETSSHFIFLKSLLLSSYDLEDQRVARRK
jgi:hypothetical protein